MALFSRVVDVKRNRFIAKRVRSRILSFDSLETRRLLAGLDVFVYSDTDGSRGLNSPMESGVARQVVFVDLNRNGSHDAGEPIAVTNKSGIASFSGLPLAEFDVRLLGTPGFETERLGTGGIRIQTSPVRASSNEQIVADLAFDEILATFPANEFLGRLGSELQRFNAAGDLVGPRTSIPGQLVDSAFEGQRGWLLVDSETAGRELLLVTRDGLVGTEVDASRWQAVEFVGENLYAWDSSDGLLVVDPAGGGVAARLEMPTGGQFERIRSLGSDRVVVEEIVGDATRLSVHRLTEGRAVLEAERTFDQIIANWQTRTLGDAIFVETTIGVHVLDTADGLRSKHVFSAATSPILVDAVADLVYTGVRGDGEELSGWDLRLGKRLDSLRVERSTIPFENAVLSSDGRFVVVPGRDGLIFRSMSEAVGTTVNLANGPVERVAIGVQLVGVGRPIAVLDRAETVAVLEDHPREIRIDDLFPNRISGTFVVVVQPPERGSLEWSAEGGGEYIPFENAEGQDGFTVALFDGRNWSASHRVELYIEGVNDPPTAIRLPHRLTVLANSAGAVVGPISVKDVDSDAVYGWIVSDPRFEVRDGVLKLRDDVSLSSSESETITFQLRAVEIKDGFVVVSETDSIEPHSIETTVSLQVLPNSRESVFFVAPEYSVPENVPGVSLGYVYVSGELSADQYSFAVSDDRFEVVDGLFKLKDNVSLAWKTADALPVTLVAYASSGEQLTKGTLIRVIPDRNSTRSPYDVDGDGFITPLDVLILVNHINTNGTGAIPEEGEGTRRIDVDGDGLISPIDVLILINIINSQSDGGPIAAPPVDLEAIPLSGEGERSETEFGYLDDIAPDVKRARRAR
ncbi:dockerin type I domain-containing protein [Pirellulaceae bacterium SH449]